MTYFIGIDTSTTATKTLLMDESGVVLGVASNEYSFETPQPLWSEQDPALWWHATSESIRQVLAKTGVDAAAVKGIGLTGQMHGLVLLDEKGDVLRPAILWNDQRTGSQCDAIRAKLGREKLIQITGNDALTGFTAPKILWVQEHEPEIWKRARHILLPKDYRALQADWRIRQRPSWWRRYDLVRSGKTRLVTRSVGCAGHPGRVSAQNLRRDGCYRHTVACRGE